MGHFINAHFYANKGLPPRQKEIEADRQAGCAVAITKENWSEAKELLQRLRAPPDDPNNFDYPDVSESLEKASQGYVDCGGSRDALVGSPPNPNSVGVCSIIEESKLEYVPTGECRLGVLKTEEELGPVMKLVIKADADEQLGDVCHPLQCHDFSSPGCSQTIRLNMSSTKQLVSAELLVQGGDKFGQLACKS